MKKAAITVLKALIFFAGWLVLVSVINVGDPEKDPVMWRFFAELIPLAAIAALTAVFLWLEKGQVRIPLAQNAGRGTLAGLATGALWLGLACAIPMCLGCLFFRRVGQVSYFRVWVLAAFLNVVMQELLIRGYLYQMLRARHGVAVATAATTALFTLLHGGAIEAGPLAVINVITMSLFMTALYEAEGTLLAPIMAHGVWNVVGALFLGTVSLAEDYPSLCEATASGSVLLSGGAYQIEASLVVTVLNVGLAAAFFFLAKKRARRGRKGLNREAGNGKQI